VDRLALDQIAANSLSIRGVRISATFDWFARLVRQEHEWSLAHCGHLLWGSLTNIPRQLEIFQILKLPAFEGLARIEPRLPFKYLAENYLARSLTTAERASCFIHHYRQLSSRFPHQFLHQALHGDVTLVELREGCDLFALEMGMSRRGETGQDREGEMSLRLRVDGTVVFVLAFTIVPGWVVASEAVDVLLVSRLQGIRGRFDQISRATRALHDVAPAALLTAALQGVAKACGIGEMAGVSGANQTNYTEDLDSFFKSAYDDFFVELGAKRIKDKFFSCTVPLPEKPLAEVKEGHKTRTKEKRAFKLNIAEDVYRLIVESS
jgi:uncharacterized protein VirK/YbjX